MCYAHLPCVHHERMTTSDKLLYCRVQDLEPCASIEEISQDYNLFKLCCNRSWHIQACDARSGAGLAVGLEWLSHQLVAADNSVSAGVVTQ